MVTKKAKIFILCMVILLGAALLGYGAFYHSAGIRSGQKDDPAKLAELEADLIKAASTGGKHDEPVKIKRKYTGNAPKARPT